MEIKQRKGDKNFLESEGIFQPKKPTKHKNHLLQKQDRIQHAGWIVTEQRIAFHNFFRLDYHCVSKSFLRLLVEDGREINARVENEAIELMHPK